MKAMNRAPWTLKVYAALGLVGLGWIVVVSVQVSAPVGAPLSGCALVLLLLVFTLRGSRVAWCIELAFALFSLAGRPFFGGQLWLLPFEILDLALLCAPPTWCYIWAPRTARMTQPAATNAAAVEPDVVAGRTVGWHVDPENRYRMRYWSRDGEWAGKTVQTPRKVLREWEAAARSAD